MQPLILVKTNVLVTDSVQNIASRSAGAATEVRVKLNIFSNTNAAMTIAALFNAMNR